MARWPKGVICPTCGAQNPRFIPARRIWECRTKHPLRQFSAKVGTIFEDSPLGLDKWFAAMWMICNDKNGVSSYEVGRALGITQKSAWFMNHRIRKAMQSASFEKMKGRIEVDETYIGGKARFMHREKRAAKIKGTGGMGKSPVISLLERHGPDKASQVRALVVPTNRRGRGSVPVQRAPRPGRRRRALRSVTGKTLDYKTLTGKTLGLSPA